MARHHRISAVDDCQAVEMVRRFCRVAREVQVMSMEGYRQIDEWTSKEMMDRTISGASRPRGNSDVQRDSPSAQSVPMVSRSLPKRSCSLSLSVLKRFAGDRFSRLLQNGAAKRVPSGVADG